MKKLIKWILIVISVLAMIFLLLRLGFKIAYTIKPELGYSFIEDKAPKGKSIQSFGADKQYVSVGLDRNPIGNNISMSQNYFVTASYKKRVDAKASKNKIDQGESIIITTYDLNTPDFTKKTFDLLPKLLNEGINQQVFDVTAITFEGKEYLELRYYITALKDGILWYNMETEEVEYPKGRDYQTVFGLLGKEYDVLDFSDKISSEYGVSIGKLNLNYDYEKAKNLENTNLALELPKVAENLSNGDVLYARPGQVNIEEWFNTALHWFAPKGQEIMEIYAKDLETGEKTQIKSYADFEEWEKAHPSND